MIEMLQLPTLQTLSGTPKASGNWAYRENLGDLKPSRISFSGAGKLEAGVFHVSPGETVTITYPLLPGHLYKLSGSVNGSAELTVGGAKVSSDGAFVPKGENGITLSGGVEGGTVTDLQITLLQSPDFSLAHQN